MPPEWFTLQGVSTIKPSLSASLLVAGLLVSVVAVACGGGSGGELSLEQYFDRVDSAVEELQERTDALDQPLALGLSSEADQVEAARDAFTTVRPIFRDFIDDLDELKPPEDVASAHGELVAAFSDLVDGLEDLIDQLAEVETAAEFSALLFDPDSSFGLAVGRLAAVCLKLQDIADDNGIEANLLDCAG